MMHFARYLIIFNLPTTICLILLLGRTSDSAARFNEIKYNAEDVISKTIIVDHSGHGDFNTIQQAIDSIPDNNQLWIRIHTLKPVFMRNYPEKEYIFLEGDGMGKTFIAFSDGGIVADSPILKMFADNFVASDITFKNTYNHKVLDGNITWAPAAAIYGDKASFYRCGFVSVHTLSDIRGRHYFQSCHIEGAYGLHLGQWTLDTGQSFYQGWDAWNFKGDVSGVTFAEEGCFGAGANKSHRVKWEKKLSPQDLSKLISVNHFINQDGWLGKQPTKPNTNTGRLF